MHGLCTKIKLDLDFESYRIGGGGGLQVSEIVFIYSKSKIFIVRYKS